MRTIRVDVATLTERVAALDRLMAAKFVTLETLMQYQAEKVALALAASQTAIDKADVADEKARDRLAEDVKARFASVNEFRGALADSQTNNLARSEFVQFQAYYTEQHTLLRDRFGQEIADLKARLDRAEGRGAGANAFWGYLVGAVGLVGAIIALVFRNIK